MTILVWQTPAGNLGKVPEQVFYQQPIVAVTNDATQVYYRAIAGVLPDGIQINQTGLLTGTPSTSIIDIQGVPAIVNRDVTSTFTIRAFTTKIVQGKIVVDQLADRTFSITVTGQDVPRWITPAGSVGTFYDGGGVDIVFQYDNLDTGEPVVVRSIAGELPGGLTLTPAGRLFGYIQPAIAVGGSAGYDLQGYNLIPYDFGSATQSKNYQFTLEVFDGQSSDVRTFSIFVYSKSTMTADNTQVTADNTFITADVTTARSPFLLNSEPSNLGSHRSDNYFAYRFIGEDYDTLQIRYSIAVNQGFGLPPGLTLDPVTGWLYGYIPAQSQNTEITYSFTITVQELDNPTSASVAYPFTLTITSALDNSVVWISPENLGSIDNGGTSLFSVAAEALSGETLAYRLVKGDFNQLPQGLELLPSGDIVGRVSFDTFALDNGTTTFDSDILITRNPNSVGTSFDSEFEFTVDAYAPALEQIIYKVDRVLVNQGGSGYSSLTPPTLVFGTPLGAYGVQAESGSISILGGTVVAVDLSESGDGYTTPPSITITNQGGGAGASFTAIMAATDTRDVISSTKTFKIKVVREYNKPYQNLYCVAMPPFNDRTTISNLLTDTNIFVPDYIYRSDDPNFGVSTQVKYFHAYGLNPATYETYVSSLYINHYGKNLVLGAVETAQALDADGNVVYEVVYSRIVDNLVNADGDSVSKSVNLPYEITDPADPNLQINTVYPNSLINMRDQVIDVVGQYSRTLPLWMTSTQSNGQVLGFTPAWVICYTKPGRSTQIAYYLQTEFTTPLNQIDFDVDRYELDLMLSVNWDSAAQSWTPAPSITTFDRLAHYQLPSSNDSTLILNGGTGYAVGDQIRILGSQVGGVDVYNDIVLTVAVVDNSGAIDLVFCYGIATAPLLGSTFTNVSGTNVSGTGTGAAFDFDVVGLEATTFDANSIQFTVPVDMYNPTDVYDKYLVFPRVDILV